METRPIDARGRCQVSAACGGCPQIEVDPQLTHANKVQSFRQALSILGIHTFEEHIFEASSPVGYRNRIRLRVFEDGRFGFFNEHKSPDCIVLEPGLRALLDDTMLRLSPLREDLKSISHLELRMPDADGRGGVYFSAKAPVEETSRKRLERALSSDNLLVGGLAEAQVPTQRFMLGEGVFQYVPLNGFMQVNHTINHSMIAWLLKAAQLQGVRSVLDLYCGSGNFLLPLLASHYEGSGVEQNEDSILAARAACQDQHLSGKFFCADAMSWVKEQQRPDFDLVIVDAPRAGLKEGAQHVAQLAAEHVVIFSCNPKTLLRDLTALTQAGYCLKTLSFFDMFAYTDHLELAVWLSRD